MKSLNQKQENGNRNRDVGCSFACTRCSLSVIIEFRYDSKHVAKYASVKLGRTKMTFKVGSNVHILRYNALELVAYITANVIHCIGQIAQCLHDQVLVHQILPCRQPI